MVSLPYTMKPRNFLRLLVAIVASELAGVAGSLFTIPSISTWYAALTKPALTPPSWLFGPVWTTLYLLMGIAAFLAWKKGLQQKEVRVALSLFGIQLILNVLWSVVFFGLHDPLLAFVNIILLWIAIICTMVAFRKVSPSAFYLLIPYILWVSFAAYLNLAIVMLN
jgi:translocator protein